MRECAHSFYRLAGTLAITACAAGHSASSDTTRTADVRQAIEQRMQSFVTLLRSNSFVDSVSAYNSKDIKSYENLMEVPDGAALQALFTDVARTMHVDSFSVATREVFVHDGGSVAYQFGSYFEQLSYLDGKKPPEKAHNNFMARWVKEPDGMWRMSRFMATPAPPAQR